MTPKPVERMVPKSSGAFAESHAEIECWLEILRGLLKSREQLKTSPNSCRQALQRMDTISNYHENERQELLKLRKVVVVRKSRLS